MNLKCIHCEGEAEYLLKGTSYCKEHLPAHCKLEETPNEDWDKLENEVNDAVRKKCHIDFSSKNIYQSKYQQECAEIISSRLGMFINNVIFFLAAVGVSFAVGGISVFLSIRDISLIDLGKIVLFIGIGLFLLLITSLFAPKGEQQYEVCNKIILNAEKRIQTLNKEKE